MDSGARIKPETPSGVSFKTLGLVLGSVAVGGALTVLFLRAVVGGTESVSVVGLFGFLFMLILATVAITLSVVSISLSRKVERAVMQRGVTVQAVSDGKSLEGQLDRLREEIRTDVAIAIQQSLPLAEPQFPVRVDEQSGEKSELMKPFDKADKKYCDFKDIVLLGVSNYPGVSSRKVGEGHYRTMGDELVDGSFLINQEQVAVCVFSIGDLLAERFFGKEGEKFSGFLRALSAELKQGAFSRVFLVFDGVLNNSNSYAKALNEFSSRVDASAFSRFELFEGSPEIVIPELTERVSQLMAQEADDPAS